MLTTAGLNAGIGRAGPGSAKSPVVLSVGLQPQSHFGSSKHARDETWTVVGATERLFGYDADSEPADTDMHNGGSARA